MATFTCHESRWCAALMPVLARLRFAAALTAVAIMAVAPARAQITTPKEHFGFNIGDDYHLATYTQFESYVRKLADESPRMVLEEIGKTAEGRPHLMAIITSPENHQRLARFKDISRRLALAEGLTDEEARELASNDNFSANRRS